MDEKYINQSIRIKIPTDRHDLLLPYFEHLVEQEFNITIEFFNDKVTVLAQRKERVVAIASNDDMEGPMVGKWPDIYSLER